MSYSEQEWSGVALNQGACGGLRVQADVGVQLFQGGGCAVYVGCLATAVQGGDTDGAGEPPLCSGSRAVVNPFERQDSTLLAQEAAVLLPQLAALRQYRPSLPFPQTDWDMLQRADKQFVRSTAGAAVHEPEPHTMRDEWGDETPLPRWQASSRRREILLHTVWGVYGYYRRHGGQWILNLKTNREMSTFYRETMFF